MHSLVLHLRSWGLLLLIVSQLLVACQSSPTPSPASKITSAPPFHGAATLPGALPADRIVVQFMAASAVPDNVLTQLITTFEENNPTIHIELLRRSQLPDDWPRQADVALGGAVWSDVVKQGLVLDLTPFIEADANFNADDFYPGALADLQWGGGMWGIPIGLTFRVLAYRPDLFQEAGIPLPQAGWAWTDLMEAARHLGSVQSGMPSCSFFQGSERDRLAVNWIEERAGPLYRHNGELIVPALDRPQVLQAVQSYLEAAMDVTVAITDSVSATSPASVEDGLSRIHKGEVAMALVAIGIQGFWQREQYPNIAIAPLPQPDFDRQMFTTLQVAISAGTAHSQAAWHWADFLSHQSLGLSGDLPARRSVAELSKAWDNSPSAPVQAIRAILDSYEQSWPARFNAPIRFVYSALLEALYEVQYRNIAPADALTSAQQQASSWVSDWEQERAIEPIPFDVATPQSSGASLVKFQVDTDQTRYTAAAAEFARIHPEWRVRVEPPASPLSDGDCMMVTLDRNGLTSPDIRSFFLPIDPLIELDGNFEMSGFFPQAAAMVDWAGQSYAVPATIRPLVLYYSPHVFERLTLPQPTSNWTVEDVLAAAAKITAADQGLFGYLPGWWEVPFLLEQQGIELFTDGTPPQPRFVAPEVAEAIVRLRRLSGSSDENTSLMRSSDLIFAGKVGMWFNLFTLLFDPSSPSQSSILPLGINVTAIRPRPGTVLPFHAHVYGLTAQSRQPQICWQWIIFLLEKGVYPTKELPALQSGAQDETTRQALGVELHTAYLEALRWNEETSPHNTVAQEWALWWFRQALREDAGELEAALLLAQEKATAFLNCLGPTDDQDLDKARSCAQQIDPQHPLAQMER